MKEILKELETLSKARVKVLSLLPAFENVVLPLLASVILGDTLTGVSP